LTFNDPRTAGDILEGLKTQRHIVAAGIYAGDGKLFARFTRAPGQGEIPAAAPAAGQVFFTSNRLKLFHRIVLDGEPIGAVYVESDLEEMRQRGTSYLFCVGVILVGCALLAFLLSSRLQRVISGPLLRLATTAQVVSLEKDYSLRAVKDSQDEIGHLIDSFNEMLGQIQHRDQELNRHREHLEEEIAKRTAALRRSEKHFRLLFSTIPLPVLVYDNQTRKFLEVNDTALAHYGYTQSEFLSMKISDIQLPHEKPSPAGQGEEPKPSGQYSEKHRTKQGKTIEVDLSSHTIEFGDGQATLVAVQDVTDRRRMEVELRHAQKLEAVGQLAAGIAHEINTPIQHEPGLPEPGGERRPCHRRRGERDGPERPYSRSDGARGRRSHDFHCRHRVWDSRTYPRQNL
jgi:PAS domain S-box-containing protein